MKYVVGLRSEIETDVENKYTTYQKVYRWGGQEFPALRDLVGKLVVLRNGERAFCTNSANRLVLFINGVRQPYVYGRKLTANLLTKNGNVMSGARYKNMVETDKYDIISVLDVDGNLFWERKAPIPKEKPISISVSEVERLLEKVYGKKVNIILSNLSNRHVDTVKKLLEAEPEKPAETIEMVLLKKKTEKFSEELKAMAM